MNKLNYLAEKVLGRDVDAPFVFPFRARLGRRLSRWRNVFFLVLGSTGWAVSPLQAKTLKVDDFGALGDGKKDDIAAVVAAVRALREAGPGSRLEFTSGKTYRLGTHEDSIYQIDLQGLKDVTVDGQGAMLLTTPEQAAIRVKGCEGVTVRNLIIEQDPLAFTQGPVTKVMPEAGQFEFKVMDGYPPLPTPAQRKERGFMAWRWGAFIDPQLRRIRKGVRDHFRVETIDLLEDGHARVKVQADFAPFLAAVRLGDIYVQAIGYDRRARVDKLSNVGDYAYNILFENSAECVLENVTLYSGRSSMSSLLQHNHGRITMRGYKVMVRPGTDRAISNFADGVHCKDNRVGPLIEQCYFQGMLDDSINMSQNTMMAEKIISPDTFRLTRFPGPTVPWTKESAVVREGDRLMVLYPTTGEYLGPFKVTKVGDDLQTITLEKPLENVVAGQIRANTDINATHFYNLDQSNAGFIIRNNIFGPQRRHAILARSENGLIENNLIVGTGGAAIELSNEFGFFYEGPIARNVVIRNNTIRDCYGTPIVVGSATGKTPTRQARNIRIADNWIEAEESPAIRITNAQDVVLENNRFVRPDGSKLPDPVQKD
jgi:hypothetical protein